MTTSIEALMQRLNECTTERNYHMGVSAILATRIEALEAVLTEIFAECNDARGELARDIKNMIRAALAKDAGI
jgi:hypothetical protein